MTSSVSPATRWRVAGRSALGATHQRSGLPNQDAIGWMPEESASSRIVLAVADGHGNRRSFRSHLGSRLAVDAALRTFSDLLSATGDLNLSDVKRFAEDGLARQLVQTWRDSVDEELRRSPITADERDGVESREGAKGLKAIDANPYLPFGSTLLTVFLNSSFALFAQLGDGDILVISDDGQVSRPLPGDERLLANESTSLCLERAWDDMRVGFVAFSDAGPAMVLAATDGYTNAFVDDDNWRRVGSDILGMIRTDGLRIVEGELHYWLDEASRTASGDDVTLGIIVRSDIEGVDHALSTEEQHDHGSSDAQEVGSIEPATEPNV